METNQSWNETIAAMAIATGGNDYHKQYVFYLYIVSQCRVIFDPELPAPAAINFSYDHYNLFINPTMWDTLPIEHRVGIVKHEVLHILYNHVFRKKDRDHKLFNLATDCALNQHIDRKHLPDGAIYPEILAKMITITSGAIVDVPTNQTAEDYYDLIMPHAIETPEGSGATDDHSKWEESKGDPTIAKDMAKKMLDKAVEETQRTRGDLPQNLAEMLDVLSHRSNVRWQQVLKRIAGNKKVGSKSTLLKPNRRLPEMNHLKGKIKDRKYDLLVVADVSGSVSDRELVYGLAEVAHIAKLTQTPVDMVQIDTEAYPPEKLSTNIRKVVRKGSGGTTLFPAVSRAYAHGIRFNAIVVITDGGMSSEDIAAFDGVGKPIIWLLTDPSVKHSLFTSTNMQAFTLKVPK
jgi:predicted metal-dependent peptidase